MKTKRLLQNGRLAAFALHFCIALFSFVGMIIRGKGIFTLCNDFNKQQIPFNMLCNNAIRTGEIFWNWNIDLGSSFTGAFGFYVLGSPFAWLGFLFPPRAYPYLAGWLYILKYTVAGLTAYLYISRFTQKRVYALCGSMLYAFSGFQSVNLIFSHFHEVVAFFPLLLIGLEKLMTEKKKGIFALAVGLNALVNYYFFVQEVIFLALYFLCRQGPAFWKKGKEFGRCLVEGAMGVGLAGLIFIPSVLFTMENPRISKHLPVESWFPSGRRYFLQLFRAFFFPGELMLDQSSVVKCDWSSWSAYLPMVGVGLACCYFLNKKWNWLSSILAFCFLFSAIPVLNSMFGLFSDTNYHRWYYMMILMMSLASGLVIEEREKYPVCRVYAAQALLMAVGTAAFYWWSYHKFELVFKKDVFTALSAVGVLGTVAVLFLFAFVKREALFKTGMLVGIAAVSVITTAATGNLYQKYSGEKPEDYYDKILAFSQIGDVDEKYRVMSHDNVLTMTVPVAGTGSFTSMVSGSIFRFYEGLGTRRPIFTPDGPDGTSTLLSAGYYVMNEQEKDGRLLKVLKEGERQYYLYEISGALPIGFTYDDYITQTEFKKLAPGKRSIAMLQCLVVSEEWEEKLPEGMRHFSVQNIGSLVKGTVVAQRRREASTEFNRDKNGFDSVIRADDDKYAFFSVPYDEGWSAEVNGEETQIMEVNGMMAIPVEQGENVIRFEFVDYDLLAGAACTAVSFLILAVYCTLGESKIWRRGTEHSIKNR